MRFVETDKKFARIFGGSGIFIYLYPQKKKLKEMKIGDQVRFLNEIGGGRVAGFQGKNIVLVEDADGFQVPMLMTEVVVVGEEDYGTKHLIEVRGDRKEEIEIRDKQSGQETVQTDSEPEDKPITFKAKPVERRGGDRLSAYLAFVPMDMM